MSTKRNKYLGIKLTKTENNALLNLAKRQGLAKSILARQYLRDQLIAEGAITLKKTSPQVEQITQGAKTP